MDLFCLITSGGYYITAITILKMVWAMEVFLVDHVICKNMAMPL